MKNMKSMKYKLLNNLLTLHALHVLHGNFLDFINIDEFENSRKIAFNVIPAETRIRLSQ